MEAALDNMLKEKAHMQLVLEAVTVMALKAGGKLEIDLSDLVGLKNCDLGIEVNNVDKRLVLTVLPPLSGGEEQ